MSSIWVAVIAVMGTLAGASVTPIVRAIAKGSARRSKRRNARQAAARNFSVALHALAEHSRVDFDGTTYRRFGPRPLRQECRC
jgi:hypothetical protein